jgi:hypothetical protein
LLCRLDYSVSIMEFRDGIKECQGDLFADATIEPKPTRGLPVQS